MKNKKLFFVLLIILLIFGSFFSSFVSYYAAKRSFVNQLRKTTLPLTSDNVYSEIQKDLLKLTSISSMMANDTFVINWVVNGERNKKEIISYLDRIHRVYGTVSSFFVSERTRIYYHYKGIIKKVSLSDPIDKWFFRVRKMKKRYEINIDTDTSDINNLTLFVNYKLLDFNGKFLGAIGVGMNVKAAQKLIESFSKRFKREVYFINNHGKVVLSGISYKGVKDIHQIKGLRPFLKKIFSKEHFFAIIKEGKENIYFNSRYIPELGWYLIVSQKEGLGEMKLKKILLISLGVSSFVSILIVFLVIYLVRNYQKKLEIMAITDKLTGTTNRHIFDMIFKKALSLSKRKGKQLSAIMIDIDKFKEINDKYGHPVGDKVLKIITEVIKNSIRGSDIIFRWGGDEFFILLPETNPSEVKKVAEKIRRKIEGLNISEKGSLLPITISVGTATVSSFEEKEDLIKNSDNALYRAKRKGRNRVEE